MCDQVQLSALPQQLVKGAVVAALHAALASLRGDSTNL
jgi:hypothetical protein